MRLGVLRETKDREFRVSLLPAGARALCARGHTVLVERGAGSGSGFSDPAYMEAGAEIVEDAAELIERAELLTKVKEPTLEEVDRMRPGQGVFAFLHLAALAELCERMLAREIVALAYETVAREDGSLPILAPMSTVAGRLSVQIGAHWLQADQGGCGVLLGGVPGVVRGRVCVLGAGIVGTNALDVAVGLGAQVQILDIDPRRLAQLHARYRGAVETLYSNSTNLEATVAAADLVIGAVLVPGARAPRLVDRAQVARMHAGAVIVDVAVDQGGCVETIHPTSHSTPTYTVDEVIHYGVPNIPGAVPRTSTFALCNASFPYLQRLCDSGIDAAIRNDPDLGRAVNCFRGHVTQRCVAAALGQPYRDRPWHKAD